MTKNKKKKEEFLKKDSLYVQIEGDVFLIETDNEGKIKNKDKLDQMMVCNALTVLIEEALNQYVDNIKE